VFHYTASGSKVQFLDRGVGWGTPHNFSRSLHTLDRLKLEMLDGDVVRDCSCPDPRRVDEVVAYDGEYGV
jgi:hypothetical protein